jgi:hypothetical protein
LPFCPNCGSPVNETDAICIACQSSLDPRNIPYELLGSYTPPKRSKNFTNGFFIGASAIGIIITLLLWSSLNSTYQYQQNLLQNYQGTQFNEIRQLQFETVGSIELCIGVLFFAGWFLFVSAAQQFNSTMRAIAIKNEGKSNWGLGLTFGGVFFLSYFISDIIKVVYPIATELAALTYWDTVYSITGTFLLLFGIGLTLRAYYKTDNLVQKFTGQTLQPQQPTKNLQNESVK